MAAIKRPRETRNGRFWMLIELKKSCIGESDAGNQTGNTATKPRNARHRQFSNLLTVTNPIEDSACLPLVSFCDVGVVVRL